MLLGSFNYQNKRQWTSRQVSENMVCIFSPLRFLEKDFEDNWSYQFFTIYNNFGPYGCLTKAHLNMNFRYLRYLLFNSFTSSIFFNNKNYEYTLTNKIIFWIQLFILRGHYSKNTIHKQKNITDILKRMNKYFNIPFIHKKI